jgi:hypothetical protein
MESAGPTVDFGFGIEDFFFRLAQLFLPSFPANPGDGRIAALLFGVRDFCA